MRVRSLAAFSARTLTFGVQMFVSGSPVLLFLARLFDHWVVARMCFRASVCLFVRRGFRCVHPCVCSPGTAYVRVVVGERWAFAASARAAVAVLHLGIQIENIRTDWHPSHYFLQNTTTTESLIVADSKQKIGSPLGVYTEFRMLRHFD